VQERGGRDRPSIPRRAYRATSAASSTRLPPIPPTLPAWCRAPAPSNLRDGVSTPRAQSHAWQRTARRRKGATRRRSRASCLAGVRGGASQASCQGRDRAAARRGIARAGGVPNGRAANPPGIRRSPPEPARSALHRRPRPAIQAATSASATTPLTRIARAVRRRRGSGRNQARTVQGEEAQRVRDLIGDHQPGQSSTASRSTGQIAARYRPPAIWPSSTRFRNVGRDRRFATGPTMLPPPCERTAPPSPILATPAPRQREPHRSALRATRQTSRGSRASTTPIAARDPKTTAAPNSIGGGVPSGPARSCRPSSSAGRDTSTSGGSQNSNASRVVRA